MCHFLRSVKTKVVADFLPFVGTIFILEALNGNSDLLE